MYLMLPFTDNQERIFRKISNHEPDKFLIKDIRKGRVMVRNDIDGIVVGNDIEAETLPYIKEAKKKNIKIILIQDRHICNIVDPMNSYKIKKFFSSRSEKREKKPFGINYLYGSNSDLCFSWGQKSSKILLENGAKKTFNAGKILFESIATSYKNDIKTVLYVPFDEGIFNTRKEYSASFNRIKHMCKIFGIRLLVRKDPLYKDIKESDAILTDFSSIAMDAIIYEKYLGIVLHDNDHFQKTLPYPATYVENDVAEYINTREGMNLLSFLRKSRDKDTIKLARRSRTFFLKKEISNLGKDVSKIICKELV